MNDYYDVFISHAFEDKNQIARPLAEKLTMFGLGVWYDEFTLKMGDSLLESIDHGLARSKFGVVILSKAFFAKGWSKYELRGLVTKELGRGRVVLPIWHNISHDELTNISPSLADKYALDTSKQTLDEIVLLIIRVVRPDIFENLTRYAMWLNAKRNAKLKYYVIKDVKVGPIRHRVLHKDILVRAKIVHKILKDVIGVSLANLIENFQREMYPHEELAVWERIAATYLDLTAVGKISYAKRRLIFSNLLSISLQPPHAIESMLKSGDAFTKRLVRAYLGVVPPLPRPYRE